MAKRPTRSASAGAKAPANAMPLNPKRGETGLKLGDKFYPIALTMNALVEIEEGLGVSIDKLGEALAKPSVKQLRTMLGALVRGGGTAMTDEELGAHPFDPDQAGQAIMASFEAAGLFTPGEAQAPQM